MSYLNNIKIKVVFSSIFGGVVVGLLLIPILEIVFGQIKLFLPYGHTYPSILISLFLGGFIGYFRGKRKYARYLINQDANFQQKLPMTNWYLIGTTLVIVGLTAFLTALYYLLNSPRNNFNDPWAMPGYVFAEFFFSLIGSVGAILLSFMLSYMSPKLNAKGFRNVVLIFMLSFFLIFLIFEVLSSLSILNY